jgi:GH25 family lysozyme M1 (1,4-beta-N-acetylmuramidase)
MRTVAQSCTLAVPELQQHFWGEEAMVFGMDTASVGGNKDVSWQRAKADGPISFALLRAAWGTAPDTFFLDQWEPLKKAGIVAGTYMYLRFRTEKHGAAPTPAAQAKAWLELLKGRITPKQDFPPAIDVEFPKKGAVETKLTAPELLDGIREAWKIIADHFGVAPMVYTSARVWREDLKNLPAPDLSESPLWAVRYVCQGNKPAVRNMTTITKSSPKVPPPWGDGESWFLHQYQGDALSLPGFAAGKVDMNRFHVITRGDSGGNVRWTQRRLGMAKQTGDFDEATETTLRAFQSKSGLSVDGVLGPKTFARLAWA